MELLFDNEAFLEFRDHVTAKFRGMVPICSGVLPILGPLPMTRFTGRYGDRLPAATQVYTKVLGDDTCVVSDSGVEHATNQCEGLVRGEVSGLRFYTLYGSESTSRIPEDPGRVKSNFMLHVAGDTGYADDTQ